MSLRPEMVSKFTSSRYKSTFEGDDDSITRLRNKESSASEVLGGTTDLCSLSRPTVKKYRAA